MAASVVKVESLPDFRLKIQFINGSEAVVDMSRRIHAMRFHRLSDPEIFAAVTVENDFVIWAGKGEVVRASVSDILESMLMY